MAALQYVADRVRFLCARMRTIGYRTRLIGYRIQANGRADARGERAMALARAFIAVAALVAFSVSRSSTVVTTRVASVLLLAYVVAAFAILVRLHLKRRLSTFDAVASHVMDLGVAAAVTAATGGSTTSPFFVLFLFTLVSAAYRWGFVETLLTACAAVLLLLVDAVASGSNATNGLLLGLHEPTRLMMRSSFVLLSGGLTGYLAQSEKTLRTEAMVIASFVGQADARAGLKKTLTAVLHAALELFDAERAVLIIHEKSSDQLFQWDVKRCRPGDEPPAARSTQIARERLTTFLFAPAVSASYVVRRGAHDRFDVVAIDSEGKRLTRLPAEYGQRCVEAMDPFRDLITTGVEFGDEWSGRLFLADPMVGLTRVGVIEFAQRLIRQVAPAVHNVFLMHRLRTTAGALERARLARELHDGVIQTVTGVEMHVAALSHSSLAKTWPAVAKELKRLDAILRQEVVNLRDKMYQMRPIDVGPDQLVAALDEFVQRFQRETGIAARFVSQLDRVALPPRACREVAQILSEALINVRRHSGARNVFVRLESEDRSCRLSIDDDGCGFPFAGRLTQADLERARKGPSIIRERVRLLGGELTIESDPGHGARLEIAVPLSHYVVQ
jgi:signal transduction histidine kinase